MKAAIKTAAIAGVVWSLIVWTAFTLFTLLWIGFAPLAGSLLSPRRLSSAEFTLLIACLVGAESILLPALWGAYRLRAWACILLTVWLPAVTLFEYQKFGSCRLAAVWLAPSMVTAILLWCLWPQLERRF